MSCHGVQEARLADGTLVGHLLYEQAPPDGQLGYIAHFVAWED